MNASLNELRGVFEKELTAYIESLEGGNLYDPIKYILSLGGKRIRPTLTLLGCQSFEGNLTDAFPAALAVEIFHNFTLVHDDIMDEAPLRRGKQTVHHKWDVNAGILSGDAMLIEAYRNLSNCSPAKLPALMNLFNRTSMEVCLGQQYDMDFETDSAVTEERYVEMIGLKTAVLLGCSLEMGARIAGADENDARSIYQLGKAAGIGFQLQDDYLDAFGDPENFGKQVGGDILANKKTFLIIKALEKASSEVKKELEQLYFKKGEHSPEEKVKKTLGHFRDLKVDRENIERSESFFSEPESCLENLNIDQNRKDDLGAFLELLRQRKR